MSASTITVGEVTLPRKIGILGFADTVLDAPFSDPTWELWGMNGLWRRLPDIPEERYAAWFEIHSAGFLNAHSKASNIGSAQFDWLEKPHPFPIYHQEVRPDWPASVRYPIESIVETTGHDYFTWTGAFQLAAIVADIMTGHRVVDEVGIWGIDLVHGTEWDYQRPCAEYWIGRIEGAGVKVTIHENSALLKAQHRYGYEDENPLFVEMVKFLEGQAQTSRETIAKLQEEQAKLVAQQQTQDGAYQFACIVHEQLQKWSRGGRV